jgi:hypothetical protein
MVVKYLLTLKVKQNLLSLFGKQNNAFLLPQLREQKSVVISSDTTCKRHPFINKINITPTKTT